MKLSLYLSLLAFFSTLPMAYSQTNSPQATCIPAGEKNWPVKAIYLHGWFESAGSQLTYSRKTEFENRKVLEEIARKLQIRIAVPVAKTTNSKGMKTWSNSSLSDIETQSIEACSGDPLAANRSLIGFSNGGFKAKNIGTKMPCEQLSQYKRILAIGTQQSYSDRCNGIFKNIPAHIFPPKNFIESSALEPSHQPIMEDSPTDEGSSL